MPELVSDIFEKKVSKRNLKELDFSNIETPFKKLNSVKPKSRIYNQISEISSFFSPINLIENKENSYISL